jgi:hypothetical protein
LYASDNASLEIARGKFHEFIGVRAWGIAVSEICKAILMVGLMRKRLWVGFFMSRLSALNPRTRENSIALLDFS